MSALDRLENYNSSLSEVSGSVFDTSTPEGAFLQLVHNRGYKMYSEDGTFTELYNALTTSGNQKIQAIAGSGKALTNDTEVITPLGYKPIGDLKIGDKVLGEDGKFHDVLGVYPQGKREVLNIYFPNGELGKCCAEHLWTIRTAGGRSVDMTGKDIYDAVAYYKRDYDEIEEYDEELDDYVIKASVKRNSGLLERGKMPNCRAYEWDESVLLSEEESKALLNDLRKNYKVNEKLVFMPLSYRRKAFKFLCSFPVAPDAEGVFTILTDLAASVGKNICINTLGESFSFFKDDFVETGVKIPEKYRGCKWDCFNEVNRLGTPVFDYETDYCTVMDNYISMDEEMTCIAVDNPSHLFVLRGGIPTHNTTSLIFKIMHDIVTGEIMKRQELPNGNTVRVVNKVFVGTYLKSGAEELQKKLASWQNSLGYTITSSQIAFGTLHAEFKRCLNAMGVNTPIGNATTLNGMLRKAIDSCNVTRDGETLKQEDYKIIEGIVTYYRGRLDEKRYQHPSAMDYDLTPTMLDLLVKQYSALRTAGGIMDFEDLQELLYKYLYTTPNPAVEKFVSERYNYIYLDEFQDTSQIQYEILKKYAVGFLKDTEMPKVGKMVVVGDVQQCIYSFRGSDIDVMHKCFDRDFAPTNNSLSYNYRCPSNILSPVVSSISLNSESDGIDIKSANQGGSFKILGLRNITHMIKQLEKDLDEDMNNGKSVAILCRTNYDGLIPALFLEMNKKYRFSISGEAMTLNSALPRSLIKVAKLFTEKCTPAIKAVMKMFVSWGDIYAVNQLCDTMKQNRLSIWTVSEADLQYSCRSIYDLFSVIKKVKEENGDLAALRGLYIWLLQNKYDGDSAYCEGARACIEVLLYFLDNYNLSSVLEFEDELDALNDKMKARIGKSYDISVATVHEFKGKERDCVYIWNDSEKVFPSSRVDLENLSQVEEERRVHYIACTRAREKSIIYTRIGCQGMFVNELDADIQPVVSEIGGKL